MRPHSTSMQEGYTGNIIKVLVHMSISILHLWLGYKVALKMLTESKVWPLKKAACRVETLSWWLDHENFDFINRFKIHTNCFQVMELWAWFQEEVTWNLILKAASCLLSSPDSWPPWAKQFVPSWYCTKMLCLTTVQKTKRQSTMEQSLKTSRQSKSTFLYIGVSVSVPSDRKSYWCL